MYMGYRYIDNDSHILEPSDLWDKYLEPEFRAEAPRTISRWETSEEFDLPSTADRITFHQETHVGGHSFPDFDTGTPQRGMFAMPGVADVYEEYLGDGEFKGMFAPEANLHGSDTPQSQRSTSTKNRAPSGEGAL